MSAIFGIFHLDKSPVEVVDLEGMATSSKHRGPDGTAFVSQEFIGLGHCMLQTTPESLNENLPFTDPTTGYTITADCRIDNREELLQKLGLSDQKSIPDSQLILEVYKKWGTSGFSSLLGDFSFAIWDSIQQHLVCARDYIGIKPFYYHLSSGLFLFSSELKAIIEYPAISAEINENLVAEYLTFSLCSKSETLFRSIHRLSPGHCIVISQRSTSKQQFWSPTPTHQLVYQHPSDYTEHFLEIFEHATRCRLRSSTPASFELSGGLDSSCTVGMALAILNKQDGPQPDVYGMVFPNLLFDESPYIAEFGNSYAINVQLVDSRPTDIPRLCTPAHKTYEPPDIPNLTMRTPLIELVSKSPSRVLLSGLGGDEWFSGSHYPYLDLINHKKFTALFSQLRHSYRHRPASTLKRFFLNIAWPLVPTILRLALCKPHNDLFPNWVTNELLTRTDLSKQILQKDSRLTISNLGKLTQYSTFGMGTHVFFLEMMDRYHAKAQIEYRSPFLDRRLAEFSMAIPDFELSHCGITKKLLRDERNTLLPHAIRHRHSKADFSFFLGNFFLQSNHMKSGQRMVASEMGWIHEAAFKKQLTAKQTHFTQNPYHKGNKNWETWFTLAIEEWLRSILDSS